MAKNNLNTKKLYKIIINQTNYVQNQSVKK